MLAAPFLPLYTLSISLLNFAFYLAPLCGAQLLLLNSRCSILAAQFSLLNSRRSILAAQFLLLNACCSILAAPFLPLYTLSIGLLNFAFYLAFLRGAQLLLLNSRRVGAAWPSQESGTLSAADPKSKTIPYVQPRE